MAVIRMEQVGYYNKRKQFDGIVEKALDLPSGSETMEYNGGQHDPAPGSLFYCVADSCPYVRTSDGEWELAAAGGGAAETKAEETSGEEPGDDTSGDDAPGGEEPGEGETGGEEAAE